jgi:hypothetical protein
MGYLNSKEDDIKERRSSIQNEETYLIPLKEKQEVIRNIFYSEPVAFRVEILGYEGEEIHLIGIREKQSPYELSFECNHRFIAWVNFPKFNEVMTFSLDDIVSIGSTYFEINRNRENQIAIENGGQRILAASK